MTYVPPEYKGELFEPTMRLRWIEPHHYFMQENIDKFKPRHDVFTNNEGREFVLQQAFRNMNTGAIEWRNVEVEFNP